MKFHPQNLNPSESSDIFFYLLLTTPFSMTVPKGEKDVRVHVCMTLIHIGNTLANTIETLVAALGSGGVECLSHRRLQHEIANIRSLRTAHMSLRMHFINNKNCVLEDLRFTGHAVCAELASEIVNYNPRRFLKEAIQSRKNIVPSFRLWYCMISQANKMRTPKCQ